MLDPIMRQKQVASAIGFSRGHLWRMISQKRFPAPFKMGKRSIGWRQSEVQNWIDDLRRKHEAGGG